MDSVDALGEEPLAGALLAADAAHMCGLGSAEPLRKQVREGRLLSCLIPPYLTPSTVRIV